MTRKKSAGAARRAPPFLEWGGGVALVVLALFFIATSWRKWTDPLIDYGVQLYAAWQVSHGAVLYRDVDFLYGPLSQYVNAGLFACFGPHLMVLVAANLLIFAAIVFTIYRLFRAAWGVPAAWCAAAMFIAVFGFSQFSLTSNYNYATPYAHETTHGLLVCLLLVALLPYWVEVPRPTTSALLGLLFGLTLVLKPEFVLAAGLCLALGVWARCRTREATPLSAWAFFLLGALAPSAFFFALFAGPLGAGGALMAAGHGWLSAVMTQRYVGNPLQQRFLGTDDPWPHLGHHLLAALAAGVLLGMVAAAALLVDRAGRRGWCFAVAGLVFAIMLGLGIGAIDWIHTGPCLPALALLYAGFCAVNFRRDPSRVALMRLLLAVLALALLARMILNARLYQFGCFQAALAAIMVPAVMLGELPQLLRLGARARWVLALGVLALLGPGIVNLVGISQRNLSYKNVDVVTPARPSERMVTFPPELDPNGLFFNHILSTLSTARPDQSLLVLPQGLMLNFLLRLPSPYVPDGYIHSNEDERQIVDKLAAHPPDYVVVISADLSNSGIKRFGALPNEGGQVIDWVNRNYAPFSHIGGDPLDPAQHGATVMRRK